ncbi:hypothetical protein AVEN_89856-1 [Araneus ventricosus]|uniref:Uncharacterized protein n=1 Tax=Araneus ventricosus TaxID=182803 RepID=A0A4Y2D9F2_ARAVE|nr:hypothetical protein AVEN_89856-1 [Araneus ventricosus]
MSARRCTYEHNRSNKKRGRRIKFGEKGLPRNPFCSEQALAGEHCDFESLSVKPVVDKIVSLAEIVGLEVHNNGIDELVEEHSQDLTTEELLELHCVSQQEEQEEITAISKATTFWRNKRNT